MLFFPDYGFGIHRVVYTSRSLMGARPDQDEIVAEIVARSAANNRAKSITGALLACDGWFVQVLEGSRDAVKPLYDTIAADPRHAEVTLRAVDPVSKRLFARWGMKQGRTPPGGIGFDVGAASPEELLSLLKLSALSALAKAA